MVQQLEVFLVFWLHKLTCIHVASQEKGSWLKFGVFFLCGGSVASSPKMKAHRRIPVGGRLLTWPPSGGDFSHQQRSTKYVALPISWDFTSTIGRSSEPWKFCFVSDLGFSEMTGMAISGSFLGKMLILKSEINVLEIFKAVAKRQNYTTAFNTVPSTQKAAPFDHRSPKKGIESHWKTFE